MYDIKYHIAMQPADYAGEVGTSLDVSSLLPFMEAAYRLRKYNMEKANKEIAEAKDEEFVWKFRIPDITPVFKEVHEGIFKKVDDPNVYTCDDDHQNLVEQYISEGTIELYTTEEDPLRVPLKRYAIEEGRFMAYESKNRVRDGETVWEEFGYPITDNFHIVIDEDVEFDDGVEKIHKWKGKIVIKDSSQIYPFDVDGRLFANSQDMSKLLIGIAGTQVSFDNNKLKEIRNAAISTSEILLRKVSQVFGWHSKKVYQTQSSMIVRGVVKKMEDGNVDLSHIGHAKNLDIVAIKDEEFKAVGKHILNDLMNMHERYPIDCLLGFTFLAPISSQLTESEDWSGGKIGMWMVGGSGCGKTYTSLLFQNFFGNFKGSKSVLSWTATPYSIQDTGYHYKDAIYMVDDFKVGHFSPGSMNSVVTVLQNYADGTARTRLAPDSSIREGKPIRGSILITGEDLLEGMSSVMARFHVVEMDKDFMNREAGKRSYKYMKFYNGFMGRYIAWLMKDPRYVKKIVNRIEEWKDRFIGDRTSSNIDRVAQSFAYNLVGFEMFCKFLEDSGFVSPKKRTEMVKIHKNNLFFKIDKHVMDVKEATVSEVFLSTLADLINSGAVKIYDVGPEKPVGHGIKDEYIGFDDFDDYIYFFGTSVWNAVNKAAGSGKGLMHSKSGLISELVKRDIMVPGNSGNTYPKLLYGKTQSTWRILKSALGYNVVGVTDEEIENW